MSPGGIKNVYAYWHEWRWQERSSLLPCSLDFAVVLTKCNKGHHDDSESCYQAAQPHKKRKLVLLLLPPCTMSDSLSDQFRAYLLPHNVLFTRRQGGFNSLHSTCLWMYMCQWVIGERWLSAFLAGDAIFRIQILHDPAFVQLLHIYSCTSRATHKLLGFKEGKIEHGFILKKFFNFFTYLTAPLCVYDKAVYTHNVYLEGLVWVPL